MVDTGKAGVVTTMHMQGGSRPDPVAQSGDHVHERGSPEHTARVVRAKGHSVVLEYPNGRQYRFGRGEFTEMFCVPGHDTPRACPLDG